MFSSQLRGQCSFHRCKGAPSVAGMLRGHHQLQPLLVCSASSTVSSAQAGSNVNLGSDQANSIFGLAHTYQHLQGEDAALLRRLYRINLGTARCSVGEELALKYNMEQDNHQLVVSITNTWTHEQTWFNEVRTRKPQTFKVSTDKPVDPTGGGGPGKCDFCSWQSLTAQDLWGRIEATHAVTSSNLFKYGEPYHGLALFKAHDPLDFTLAQLSDLLAVSQAWFEAAHATHTSKASATRHSPSEPQLAAVASVGVPAAPHRSQTDSALVGSAQGWPYTRAQLSNFFIWNALSRAGASQYHGHAQLMATSTPVPAQAQLDQLASSYAAQHQGTDYIRDLLSAHKAAGLLRACAADADSAAVINAGGATNQHQLPSRAWLAAHLSPVKDMEVLIALDLQHPACSITPQVHKQKDISKPGALPTHGMAVPAFAKALHATLRALIDTLGVESFNVGVLNVASAESEEISRPRFMLARVVSRGRMSQPASDFGCLEVLGGASIGHTDPYKVLAAVEEKLAGCLVSEDLP